MALLQIFIIFIIPVVLLYFEIIPIKFRRWLLWILVLVVTAIVISEGWTLKQLGIRIDNFKMLIRPYALFTLAGLVVVLFTAKFLGRKKAERPWTHTYFRNLKFIPISVFQEFGYRGFLMPQLESLFLSPILVVGINAFLFAFVHIIYPKPLFQMTLGFMGGLGFAAMYYFYPNLILISLAHIILNVFAVVYSLAGSLLPKYR